jgi:GntR family transcriptional regulator
MSEPAYLRIAAEIAEQIRAGALPPGTRLSSYNDLAETHDVSAIVIRQAIGVLRSRGLVRTVERSGTIVNERPTLIRISPERQLEAAGTTFIRESGDAAVDRFVEQTTAADDVAHGLGISPGDDVTHVHTRITVGGKPAVISDYYEPLDLTRGTPIEDPERGPIPHSPIDRFPTVGYPVDVLEETLSFRSAPSGHADFLGTPPSELTVTVRQQFWSGDRVVQMSDITYPPDRYAGYAFRMRLPEREDPTGS